MTRKLIAAAVMAVLLCGCAPAQQAGTAAVAPTTITQISVPEAATVTQTPAAKTVTKTPAPKTVTKTQRETVTETSTAPPVGDNQACIDMVLLSYDIFKDDQATANDYLTVVKYVQNDNYDPATGILKNILDRTKNTRDVDMPKFADLSYACTGIPQGN